MIKTYTDDYAIYLLRSKNKMVLSHGDYLGLLSNPLEDKEYWKEIMKEINTKGEHFSIREVNKPGTKRNKHSPLDISERIRIETNVFYTLLENLSEIKNPNIQRLYNNIGENKEKVLNFFKDKEKLAQIVKRWSINTDSTFGMEANTYTFLRNVYDNNVNIMVEHLGSSLFDVQEKQDSISPRYSIRIYLNIKNEKILLKLLEKYIAGCIANKINYDMKGLHGTGTANHNDSSVLYCFASDIDKRILILESAKFAILQENPEWENELGTPLAHTSTINNSFYGICQSPGKLDTPFDATTTYNDYMQGVSKIAFVRTLAKVIEEKRNGKSKTQSDFFDKILNLDSENFIVDYTRDPRAMTIKSKNGNQNLNNIIKEFLKEYINAPN